MSAAGPLAGIRIIEVGQMIAVPAATYPLATQGVEVIKVEDPVRGDELRHYGSQKGGMSAWFINAPGKRSLGVDLQQPEGKAILWRLLETAEVMMQGFRPGVLERLGFGHAPVLERFPGIVYCAAWWPIRLRLSRQRRRSPRHCCNANAAAAEYTSN